MISSKSYRSKKDVETVKTLSCVTLFNRQAISSVIDLFSFPSYWRISHNISWISQFHRGYKFFWHKTKQEISLLIWLKSWRNDEVVKTRLHFKGYHDLTFIPMLFCPKLFLIIILTTKFLPKTLFWVPLNLVDVKTWKKSFCIGILSFFLGHCLIQHIHYQNILARMYV